MLFDINIFPLAVSLKQTVSPGWRLSLSITDLGTYTVPSY